MLSSDRLGRGLPPLRLADAASLVDTTCEVDDISAHERQGDLEGPLTVPTDNSCPPATARVGRERSIRCSNGHRRMRGIADQYHFVGLPTAVPVTNLDELPLSFDDLDEWYGSTAGGDTADRCRRSVGIPMPHRSRPASTAERVSSTRVAFSS
jgi:hypothetical protein